MTLLLELTLPFEPTYKDAPCDSGSELLQHKQEDISDCPKLLFDQGHAGDFKFILECDKLICSRPRIKIADRSNGSIAASRSELPDTTI